MTINDDLILENIKLVYYTIQKRFPKYTGDEDIVQCGMLGLCQAAKTYDRTKGAFSTFAISHVTGEIKRELTRRKNDVNTVSLNALLEENGDRW